MSIVTRTGDKGTTGLYGGKRIAKSSVRLHAYGTIDELNALIGVLITDLSDAAESTPVVSTDEPYSPLLKGLTHIQHRLFRVGADLATPLSIDAKVPRVEAAHVQELEDVISPIEKGLSPLRSFILPGGTRASALLHHARTVCRRAERWIAALGQEEDVNPQVLIYVNRLSDYLYLLAREANRIAGTDDVKVEYD